MKSANKGVEATNGILYATTRLATRLLLLAQVALVATFAGCATTNTYDEAKRLEGLGRYGDAGDVYLEKAKALLDHKYKEYGFPSSEFQYAAEYFDRDPTRAADAVQARKSAAELLLKEAENYAANGEFYLAALVSSRMADLYKSDGFKKDLNDIPAAESAHLQAIRYKEAAIQHGEKSLDQGLDSIASSYFYLTSLFKGQDEGKAKRKHYAGAILALASRGTPPLGGLGRYLDIAASVLNSEGDHEQAVRALEKALQYAEFTQNTANFGRAIEMAEKLGHLDLSNQWRSELQAIEKVEGKSVPGQSGVYYAYVATPEEIEREGERRRAQAEAYRVMGEARLANLRQAMASSLLAQSRIARKEAARKVSENAAQAEQQRRDAMEAQAQREQSAKAFAQALGTAAAIMNSAKSPGLTPAYSSNSQSRQGGKETCVCGPDYIPCWERLARRDGSRYRIYNNSDGSKSIAYFDSSGRHDATKSWHGGNNCGAMVK